MKYKRFLESQIRLSKNLFFTHNHNFGAKDVNPGKEAGKIRSELIDKEYKII